MQRLNVKFDPSDTRETALEKAKAAAKRRGINPERVYIEYPEQGSYRAYVREEGDNRDPAEIFVDEVKEFLGPPPVRYSGDKRQKYFS